MRPTHHRPPGHRSPARHHGTQAAARPIRLPLQSGWWFALQIAPRDFARLDHIIRQRKERAGT